VRILFAYDGSESADAAIAAGRAAVRLVAEQVGGASRRSNRQKSRKSASSWRMTDLLAGQELLLPKP
jgi:hypothetical protein